MNQTQKVALITGGAGHIGQSIARKLSESGTRIAILDKDSDRGKKFADEINREFNSNSHFLELDLLSEMAFNDIEKRVIDLFGNIDFIVNNAAFYDSTPGWDTPYLEEGYEAWLKVMKVNLLAPFFLVQKLTPLLQKSDCASVVNVGSIYGIVAPDHRLYAGSDMTNPASYAASKGGLLALTKWLSTVLAPTIRVNMVTPGGVERGQNSTFKERYHERTPLKRMAIESDVSSAICFLLSQEAAYITGQNLVVDGGWTAW